MGQPKFFSCDLGDVSWLDQFEKVFFALVKSKELEFLFDFFDEFFLEIWEIIDESLNAIVDKILKLLGLDDFVYEATYDTGSFNNEAAFMFSIAKALLVLA